MRFSDDYRSDLLSATFLHDELERLRRTEVIVTIETIARKTFNDGKTKWVLSFSDYPRGVALGQVNGNVLAGAFGDESDSWLGRQIALSTHWGQTPNGEGHILTIRALSTPAKPAATKQPDVPPGNASNRDLDDAIPF